MKTFKYFILLTICIISLSSGVISQENKEVLKLTLEDSIKIAIQNSLDLLSVEQDIIASEARISQAETGKYPYFSAKTYYSRLHPVQSFNFDEFTNGGTDGGTDTGGDGTSNEIKLGKADQAQFTFTLSYDLYDGGFTSRLVDQNTLLTESAICDMEIIRQTVIFNVIEAYCNVLRAESLMQVAEKNMETAQEQYKRSLAFYEEGLVPKVDVTNAEAQTANAELAIIGAKINIEAAKALLNDTMNLPLDTQVELIFEISDEPFPVDLDYTTLLAGENRSEIKKVEFLTDAAETAIDVARSQNNPTIYFNFDYIPLSTTTFNPSNSITATVGATIPIFDRGLTKYKIEEAEANLEKSKITTDQVKKGIILEVKRAYLEYIKAKDQLEAVETSLKAAQENYDISVLRYQEGIAPFIEVSDSRALLTRAEVEKVQSSYNYFLSIAGLIKSAGLIPEDGNIERIKLIDKSEEEVSGYEPDPETENEL